jgi:chromosome segregation ATPase
MSGIAELEQRILAALDRLEDGVGALADRPVGAGGADPEELEELREALAAERETSARLGDQLRNLREREALETATLRDQIDSLTRQLDAQGLDIQRMRKNVMQLREAVRALREAQSDGVADPALLNRALQAELEALRAARASDLVEMDEILAELKPLVMEAQVA